ncbi:unnamed protein product [Adineta ricciae]|uniref:Uncharacterized protein n=1 Tax=Adineta ricciae TaxID=249248 RepID=A0A816BKF8_ADIRI|nr:unnamed protein product [Adineta ricciae]
MGEKRKCRMTNNERKSKKEKKMNNSVTPSASNDDIEEQSSMHSNSSNSDSNSQQPSVAQEVVQSEEIEESQTIPSIDVEHITDEDPIEASSSIVAENHKIHETTPTGKSWWSSIVRLFHFGNNSSNEAKTSTDKSINNGSYLGNVKCRRSLHGDSLVG